MTTVPLVARTPATHVDNASHALLSEPSFNLRETAYDATIVIAAAALVGFAWLAAAFAIISYGRVA